MLPTFFLVGVPKAGTTALYDVLKQHPDVYMSAHKEPNFFAQPEKQTPVKSIDQYEALFEGAEGYRAVGEASTDYFHHPEAPRRILALVPEARAIVVLRDPAERAYSHYAMLVRSGAVPQQPYLHVLRGAAEGGIAYEETYGTGTRQSTYAEALERYLALFGPERFHVCLYRDFRNTPRVLVSGLFEFLDVDPSFQPEPRRRNESSQPKSEGLHRLLRRQNALRTAARALVPATARRVVSTWVHRQNQSPLAPLGEEARALLVSYFRTDIERVEHLLDRDLSHWRRSS